MTVDIYSIEGKVTGTVELPEALFNVDVNQDLIALAVRVARANARQGTSKVKTRGELGRTTHKVWKQKGTGRARHGSKSAPIFVGGGVAHGPSGDQSYELALPKKMRVKALKGVLTQTARGGQLIVVDGLDKVDSSTKTLTTIMSKLKADKKTLVMLESPIANIIRAGKNASEVVVTQAKRTNILELINANKVVIHKPAIDTLLATFAKDAPKVEAKPVTKKSTAKKAVKKEVKE